MFAATVTYVNDVIIVTGTAAGESVTIEVTADDNSDVDKAPQSITIDGVVQPKANAIGDLYVGLQVNMLGGDDNIHFTLDLSNATALEGAFHGGDGNDKIFYNAIYGTTDFILYGDNNDDTFVTTGRGGGSLEGNNGSDYFDVTLSPPAGQTSFMEISGGDPGLFGDHLTVNGVDRTATVDDPNTGGWNFNGTLNRRANGSFEWIGEISPPIW